MRRALPALIVTAAVVVALPGAARATLVYDKQVTTRTPSVYVAKDDATGARTVLAATGGADPSSRHDIVTVPYAGGRPKVLVRGSFYADWDR